MVIRGRSKASNDEMVLLRNWNGSVVGDKFTFGVLWHISEGKPPKSLNLMLKSDSVAIDIRKHSSEDITEDGDKTGGELLASISYAPGEYIQKLYSETSKASPYSETWKDITQKYYGARITSYTSMQSFAYSVMNNDIKEGDVVRLYNAGEYSGDSKGYYLFQATDEFGFFSMYNMPPVMVHSDKALAGMDIGNFGDFFQYIGLSTYNTVNGSKSRKIDLQPLTIKAKL